MKQLSPFLITHFLPLLFLLPGKANAQWVFTPVDSLEVSCQFFTVDPLGNLFCANNEGMTKYDLKSGRQWHYSNPPYGRIHSIDASDPLNILVYHADFQQIKRLDRTLAEKPQADAAPVLSREFPTLVCNSVQGGFWVFMPQSGLLRRYSPSLRNEAQSLPFFEILPGFHSPVFLTEADGKVFVSQPDLGIAVFDNFGNFLSLVEKKGLERFQVRGNRLYWFTRKELVVFDFVLQEERLFLLPETSIRSGLLIDRTVFIQTDHEIKVYQAAGGLF